MRSHLNFIGTRRLSPSPEHVITSDLSIAIRQTGLFCDRSWSSGQRYIYIYTYLYRDVSCLHAMPVTSIKHTIIHVSERFCLSVCAAQEHRKLIRGGPNLNFSQRDAHLLVSGILSACFGERTSRPRAPRCQCYNVSAASSGLVPSEDGRPMPGRTLAASGSSSSTNHVTAVSL